MAESEFCSPVSFPAGEQWYALHTNIKCEFRAQFGLDGKGFRTFLPLMTRWISHARVRKIVQRPLLSRYLFVELDPNQQSFEDVRRTDGVEAVVSNLGVPVVIPRGLVEAFIGKQLAGEFDYASEEPLTKGAKVHVVHGEWDDLIGVVIEGWASDHAGSVMVKLLNDRKLVRLGAYAVRAHQT